ncbi:hypothetical protein D3C73_1474720 [compost metagenome]
MLLLQINDALLSPGRIVLFVASQALRTGLATAKLESPTVQNGVRLAHVIQFGCGQAFFGWT